MMPGFDSSQPIGEPVTVSAPGHTFGLTMTRKIELTTPVTTPTIAPVVLNRRHVNASSSAGKFALAATANARPTMNETFRPEPPMIAIAIAIAPIANAAIRATRTSSCSESWCLRTIEDQMSWLNAADADSTSPATTARIVANATPAMKARNSEPPNVPSPPPRNSASNGAARLPPVPGGLDARPRPGTRARRSR